MSNRQGIVRRALTIALLAAVATASLAPVAGADHFRYKRGDRGPWVRPYPRTTVYIERHDHGVPALAGFLGGLVLGAAISHPAPPPPPPQVYYYDPYCDERFASLDGYYAHAARYDHPRAIEVRECPGDRYLDTLVWDGSRWCSRPPVDTRWDDRDGD